MPFGWVFEFVFVRCERKKIVNKQRSNMWEYMREQETIRAAKQ